MHHRQDVHGVDAAHRGFDRALQQVRGAEQQVHEPRVHRALALPHEVQQRLQLVRQRRDGGVAHRRAHPLDRVHAAEDRAHGLVATHPALELEQRVVDGGDVLAALREKELGVLGAIHARQSRGGGSGPRAAATRREPGVHRRAEGGVRRVGRVGRGDARGVSPERAALLREPGWAGTA